MGVLEKPTTCFLVGSQKLSIGEKSLLLEPEKKTPRAGSKAGDGKGEKPAKRDKSTGKKKSKALAEGIEMFRIEVGHEHEVQPGNIVGAIANEAGIDAEHIGHIDIRDTYSLVELPLGMPKAVFNDLKKAWVSGHQLKISRVDSDRPPARKKSVDEKKRSKKKAGDRDKGTKRKARRKTAPKKPVAD